ncbi:MAG: Fibronectin type-III protein, partial [Patescibacteria group bacterium]|nr:Fibronectin type-III protein [Patescibacteria group bacterium]
VPGATTTNLTVGGSQVTRASYQIQDGSDLDDDGISDGNIVDPVGLASSENLELAATGSSIASLMAVASSLILASTLIMIEFKTKKIQY